MRVELDSSLEIFGRFRPPALPPIDKTEYLKRQRVVRQSLLCKVKFLASVVVIEIHVVHVPGDSKMRFA